MRALHYYDIKYTPDMNELIAFNKQNMTIGMPDKGSNPENPSSLVMREMGCQLLAMRYQKVDVNVEENDAFFEENGYAFVLKPENLRYIPVTIPAPPPLLSKGLPTAAPNGLPTAAIGVAEATLVEGLPSTGHSEEDSFIPPPPPPAITASTSSTSTSSTTRPSSPTFDKSS
jgi:hypothetical protein